MESQYQKWVNVSYFAAAIMLGYITFSIAGKVVGAYDLEVRVRNIDLILRVLSVTVGAIFFFVLNRHEQVNQFMNEVAAELSRVTWPTSKDTRMSTWVVIGMVVVSGMILGLLDYFWTQLLNWVL